jgi:hypothetical protein
MFIGYPLASAQRDTVEPMPEHWAKANVGKFRLV